MSAERIHADDTTVSVLAKLKTVTGRIWTYVRDDRPFGANDPPAALFLRRRHGGRRRDGDGRVVVNLAQSGQRRGSPKLHGLDLRAERCDGRHPTACR
jgi:transposase